MRSDTRSVPLSVLIPARNAASSLGPCLEALARSSCTPDEIIVVDDASSDATAQIARAHGAHLVSLCEQTGPAVARNRAAAISRGRTLVFVDSDVLVRRDALERIVATLGGRPAVAAVFGSYDDSPVDQGFFSRYKNLLHHYVHQNARSEASTFFTGLGAVRASAFEASGGFRRRFECIEDIEFGYRLTDLGYRVVLDPAIQGKHAKRWRFSSLLYTDVVGRAIPWARLMLRRRTVPDDLNVRRRNRIAALGVLAAAFMLAGAVTGGHPATVPASVLVGAATAGLGLATILDLHLYTFLARAGGLTFALRCIPMQWLYYLYSLVGVALAAATLHHQPERTI